MRKVIFLDIDNVLQPGFSQERFSHDMRRARSEIAEKLQNKDYLDDDFFDIAAVVYDWDKKAVENLKKLLSYDGVGIVLSTGWKWDRTEAFMRRLFHIHDLDQYITGMTPNIGQYHKEIEIQKYLEDNPDVTCYVVIDDEDFTKYFPDHFVLTDWRFDDKNLQEALNILGLQP